MSFLVGLLGGGKHKLTTPTAVSALQLQSSMQGQPIPLIYGTTRMASNLIWYGNFQSHAQQAQRSGGKGGGGTGGGKGGASGTTGYTYTTAVAMALCEGPISSVGTVYVNKDQSTLAALGLSLFTGGYSQSAWSYLVSNYSSQALNYHGIAYLAASNYNLGTNPQLPNHNFEVHGIYSNSLSSLGKVDADPSLVITDFLTNPHYGAAFPSSRVGNYSSYQAYTIANGLWVSPAYNSQSQASTMLDDLATATNSAFVWSEGVLNLIPYGDVNITANGYTYTAPSSALYSLTYDDFMQTSKSTGGSASINSNDPVIVTRKRPADQINSIKIECLNRANSYNPAIIEAKDQALIDVFGLRQSGSKQAHVFCDLAAGQMSASLQLLRQGIRNVYSFTLDQRYVLLDPMDIVELTDSNLGLSNVFVRILEITENEDRTLNFIAEEYIQGLGNTPLYSFQSTSSGFVPSTTCPPGTTLPVIVDAPQCLDPNAPAVWVAAGGPGGGFNAQKGTFTCWYNPIGMRAVLPISGHPISNDIFNTTGFGGSFGTFSVQDNWQLLSSGYQYRVVAGIETYVYPDIVNQSQGLYRCFIQMASIAVSSVPSSGFALGITWDGSGTTWVGKLFINGVDKTDYTAQSSNSFVTNTVTSVTTSGTIMGVPMDGANVFQSQYRTPTDSYDIFCSRSSGQQLEMSQPWILCDNAIDFTVSSNWALFFDVNNAPINLGTDGSLPTGRRPLFYFPYGASSIGTNTGILGNFTSSGGAITNASSIPASGSYQALGLHYSAGAQISSLNPTPVVNPEINACDAWGSCNVYISTDGGNNYTLSGVVQSPSPVGILTAALPSSIDPDTTNTLSVDLGESQQSLSSFTQSDADNFIPICAITDDPIFGDAEFVDYETATLTSSYRYGLTYLRRGIYHSPIQSWTGQKQYFARLGTSVLKIPYSSSLIGQWMFFKMQALNPVGGGAQDLSVLQTFAYQLRGPQGLLAPSDIGATETSSVVTVTWPPGQGCSLNGYDLALAKAPDYVSSGGNVGTITFWLDVVNTSSVGVGTIFSCITGATSSFNAGSVIQIYYNQTASSGTSSGKYVIVHKVMTRQASSNYALITPTTLQPISSGPIAVGISYDGSASSAWTGKILINGTDVTDTSSQTALSFHGASSGTAMGVIMDGTQTFYGFFPYATWIGQSISSDASNGTSSFTFNGLAFGMSQLWIAPGHTLDLTSSGNWAKFFDSNHYPVNLGAQGELPVSSVPYAFYPTYASEPGHNSGQQRATLDAIVGAITNDANNTSGPIAPGIMITNKSAMGQNNPSGEYGYIFRDHNVLTSSITGLASSTYTFQVRSVDALDFHSTWRQTSFNVT